jgi:hypothetical protein
MGSGHETEQSLLLHECVTAFLCTIPADSTAAVNCFLQTTSLAGHLFFFIISWLQLALPQAPKLSCCFAVIGRLK